MFTFIGLQRLLCNRIFRSVNIDGDFSCAVTPKVYLFKLFTVLKDFSVHCVLGNSSKTEANVLFYFIFFSVEVI